MDEQERQFQEWLKTQMYETERRRLSRQVGRAELWELLAYMLAAIWIIAVFVAYQAGRVDPAVAGLVTVWVIVGGIMVGWVIRRYRRTLRRHLDEVADRYQIDPPPDVDP